MQWNEAFSTIDSHVAGQPLRLITFGAPHLKPAPIRQQIAEVQAKHDHIRRWLLAEPRGHAGLTGALLVHTDNPETDYGVIFMSAGGYKPLSGHGMIALATTLIDAGQVSSDSPDVRIMFDTFSGPIQARASVDQGRVRGVRFRNVPSFRVHKDLEVEVNGRPIHVDVAYGGNWYAIAQAADLGVELETENSLGIVQAGMAVSTAVADEITCDHPLDDALSGLFGTVLVGAPKSDDATVRNATVYLDGLIDRSPCGTGMAATMACWAEDGKLGVGQAFIGESIVETFLSGRLITESTVGDYPAIIVELAGRGQITGMHTFFVDPTDALANGYVLL